MVLNAGYVLSLMRECIGGKITIMHGGGNLLYTNGPFVLTGHMVKKSAILDDKRAWHPPLGHREQRKVKLDRLEFLCVRIYHIPFPSSMVNFVPCDQLVQKAHLLLIRSRSFFFFFFFFFLQFLFPWVFEM